MRPLTSLEARVLGVLVEKQATVPDTYPLSLNSLVAGCNQKTARDPAMNASEADVLEAIEGLRGLTLLNEVSGSRVTRYEHNAGRGLGVPSAGGCAAGHADAAWPADRGGAARERRSAAPFRRHVVGRGVPRRAGGQGSCRAWCGWPVPRARARRAGRTCCAATSPPRLPSPCRSRHRQPATSWPSCATRWPACASSSRGSPATPASTPEA